QYTIASIRKSKLLHKNTVITVCFSQIAKPPAAKADNQHRIGKHCHAPDSVQHINQLDNQYEEAKASKFSGLIHAFSIRNSSHLFRRLFAYLVAVIKVVVIVLVFAIVVVIGGAGIMLLHSNGLLSLFVIIVMLFALSDGYPSKEKLKIRIHVPVKHHTHVHTKTVIKKVPLPIPVPVKEHEPVKEHHHHHYEKEAEEDFEGYDYPKRKRQVRHPFV
ncbi:uncharacterized protein, partial [Bactrocera oleae]|uniref:uncharacterized protein n=1 Tax=Bactrocera oleae TaxID=104688 RepID=UPI00387E76F6